MCPSAKTARFLVIMPAIFLVLNAGLSLASPMIIVQEIQCDIEEPVSIMIVPDGSGVAFSEARTIDGQIVDATIRIQLWLVDEYGPIGPMSNWPAEDLWLRAEEDHTQSCTQDYLVMGTGNTDSNGWTEITLAPQGGGWTQGILEVFVLGMPALFFGDPDQLVLSIHFNSPDINGDGQVSLVDVSLFSQGFFSGAAPYRCDLFWDGVLSLSDVAALASHLGSGCD